MRALIVQCFATATCDPPLAIYLEKPAAYNHGPLPMNCGLLLGVVAYSLGPFGFPELAGIGSLSFR